MQGNLDGPSSAGRRAGIQSQFNPIDFKPRATRAGIEGHTDIITKRRTCWPVYVAVGGASGGKPSDIKGMGRSSKEEGSGDHSSSCRSMGARSSEHVGRSFVVEEQWADNALKQRNRHNSSCSLRLSGGGSGQSRWKKLPAGWTAKESPSTQQQRIRRNSCNGRYLRRGRTRGACDGRPALPSPRMAQRRDGGRSSADP